MTVSKIEHALVVAGEPAAMEIISSEKVYLNLELIIQSSILSRPYRPALISNKSCSKELKTALKTKVKTGGFRSLMKVIKKMIRLYYNRKTTNWHITLRGMLLEGIKLGTIIPKTKFMAIIYLNLKLTILLPFKPPRRNSSIITVKKPLLIKHRKQRKSNYLPICKIKYNLPANYKNLTNKTMRKAV